jgi:hypothetical protein
MRIVSLLAYKVHNSLVAGSVEQAERAVDRLIYSFFDSMGTSKLLGLTTVTAVC